MALPDRSALRRRLAWLAASFALLALAGLAIWLARPDEPAPLPASPPPAPAPPPPAPVVESLSREDLVAAVERALLPPLTDDGGAPPPPIYGQRFEVVLPVRCPEALGAATGAPLTYTYDTAQAAVTLTARPQSWQGTPLMSALAPNEGFEAVEGFWVNPLPLAAPVCARDPTQLQAAQAPEASEASEAAKSEPSKRKTAEKDEAADDGEQAAAPPPPPRVGLAVFFEPGGSRAAQRRDRPYRVTRKAPPPTSPAPYNLVLSGRVALFEDGPTIRCRTPPGEPPACLIAVSFERVAFVDATSGAVLAEWDG